LFWLRWRLGMNVTTVQGRWASMGIIAMLLLAFSPIYLGGAFAAYKTASVHGRDTVLLVFGACQFAILWVSLLSGAMGRTFELDKLKRYPLSPLAVFFTNTLTSVIEPVALMTLPTLAALSIGVAQHDGLAAGLQTGLAAVVLLLVTLTLIQLLLALLDDLLRREWLRYVAAFLFIATLVGFQLTVSRVSQGLVRRARELGVTADVVAEQARLILGSLPTVAAPASIAGTHPAGPFASPWVGLVTSLAFLLLAVVVGARVMERASIRPIAGDTGGGRARGEQGLSLRVPGLTPVQGLLFGRELVYLMRTPSILFQMLITPLMVITLSLLHSKDDTAMPDSLPLFVLVSGLAGRNLMMWAYDGAGVRTLFLMPFTARDLVLTKLLGWFSTTALEATIAFTALSFLRGAAFATQLPTYVPAYLAVLLVAGVIGTNISIRQPVKAPDKGMARRSPGGLIGIGGFLAIVLTALAIGLMVVAVRMLTPDAHDALASCIVALMALAATVAIAWISLERSADLLELKREKMIDVLAKSADI
jgi:hypothetical protein